MFIRLWFLNLFTEIKDSAHSDDGAILPSKETQSFSFPVAYVRVDSFWRPSWCHYTQWHDVTHEEIPSRKVLKGEASMLAPRV
jgi:hypothetical protein